MDARTSGLPEQAQGHPIWRALVAHRIGPDAAALPFTTRLARENGWSAAEAERVLEEYRRFCFLAATTGRPMTPSDAVDQAWHLHLTYTRDYWELFCPAVLGRALHHEPTTGGPAAQHRFFDQYAETLRAYEAAFGTAPPADIWPNAARRLGRDPQARRVHPRDAFILPRRATSAVLVLAALCVVVTLLVRS